MSFGDVKITAKKVLTNKETATILELFLQQSYILDSETKPKLEKLLKILSREPKIQTTKKITTKKTPPARKRTPKQTLQKQSLKMNKGRTIKPFSHL